MNQYVLPCFQNHRPHATRETPRNRYADIKIASHSMAWPDTACDLAADVVHMPACEAIAQTEHIMQSETQGSAADIEHGLVMWCQHRLRARAGIVRPAPYF